MKSIINRLKLIMLAKRKLKKTPQVRCDIHPKAIIKIINNPLVLGAKWSLKDSFSSLLVLRENATLIVANKFKIYSGAKIYINKNATLKLGSGYINHNLNLSCFDKIEIGEGVVISENVTIRDSDNHNFEGSLNKITQPVKICNKVWVGINVTILKGVTIGDGAVIAAGSVVNKNVLANTLVGGNPAKILKENIRWY